MTRSGRPAPKLVPLARGRLPARRELPAPWKTARPVEKEDRKEAIPNGSIQVSQIAAFRVGVC